MGYDAEQKLAVRERVMRVAAHRFRGDGLAAVGVRQVMAEAGLTHGGFYRHFGSRDELVAAAVEQAARVTLGHLQGAIEAVQEDKRLDAVVSAYLAMRHCKAMANGCATAALAPEIARLGKAARRRFVAQNEAILVLIAACLPSGGNAEQRHMRAISVFALIMGTLQLARILCDDETAAATLAAARQSALTLARQPWL